MTPAHKALWIECEGSGIPPNSDRLCQFCGSVWTSTAQLPQHNRMDLLAMIERGDFEVTQ